MSPIDAPAVKRNTEITELLRLLRHEVAFAIRMQEAGCPTPPAALRSMGCYIDKLDASI